MDDTDAPAAAPAAAPARGGESFQCPVCLEQELPLVVAVTTACAPVPHVLCRACARKLVARDRRMRPPRPTPCPLCRGEIDGPGGALDLPPVSPDHADYAPVPSAAEYAPGFRRRIAEQFEAMARAQREAQREAQWEAYAEALEAQLDRLRHAGVSLAWEDTETRVRPPRDADYFSYAHDATDGPRIAETYEAHLNRLRHAGVSPAWEAAETRAREEEAEAEAYDAHLAWLRVGGVSPAWEAA